ncbi:MAG TPA: ATP-binding cassette domain-containing protein [Thermoanaerobaculia bacterium]|jgi:D-xylose transport system ATP-binding protein|nr:ATP-binding cassette domain-containing protein [Thermoanaerobaculia bacterium]
MPILDLRAIRKDFPGVRALDGVSFDLEPGEIHALCGENGAGKSTLIKVLCGVYPAGSYGGEIRLRGEVARFRSLRDSEARGIALIAQELALVPGLSVAENLVLGREPRRFGLVRWTEVEATARRALDRVGLDVPLATPVRELGIGQQQLVEIARALEKNAEILVLDEPTAALPDADARRLLGLLGELRRHGVAAIYISHRLDEVFAIADRITVLRDGRSVGAARRAEMTPERVISLMVGRELGPPVERPVRGAGESLLRVADWSVEDPQNPGRRVLDGIALDLRAGEVLGIAGLMGAGRTALLASLFGAARSRVTGTLQSAGGPLRGPFRSPAEAIAAGLALVSEDRKRYGLVPQGSVLDNMTLANLGDFSRRARLDDRARRAAVRGQAEALRLNVASLDTPVSQLSGGNQQKVVLGRWLLRRPRVLLLDEPTRGIDVGAKQEIYDLIGRLTGSGIGVLLVSSELPELLALSHRVLVLRQGRPAAELAGEAATPETVMAAAALSARAVRG